MVKITYRIYKLVDGKLKQPTISGYGREEIKYDDANSMKEATKLITSDDRYLEFVILPITVIY